MTRDTNKMPIWDLPTRLFHWFLVVNFATCWLTFELGEMEWHFYAGYSLLGLLLFRLIWGFVGSPHSRFSDFVRGPGAIVRYLRSGHSDAPGHNPLGALSILAFLGLLSLQAISGLFNADDQGNQGPYRAAVSGDWSDWPGGWHERLFDLLLILLCLHLLAIALYQLVRKQPLIQTMLKGSRPDQQAKGPPVSLWRALWVALCCAGIVWAVVALAPEPQYTAYF